MASSSSMPRRKKGKDLSNWSELPSELMYSIMLRLDAFEILENTQKVCREWRRVFKEPSMWQKIDMRTVKAWDLDNYNFVQIFPNAVNYNFHQMCRNAVDRSEGGLVEIRINFGSDDLLTYIAHRAPNLRSFGLELEYPITNYGLVNAVAKLPLLEELEVLCRWSKLDLQAIGHSFSKLKIFKLICLVSGNSMPRFHDDDAFAIAGHMPELRHLQLINNKITDIGLKAILHRCPHLEHLDLRKCSNIKLSGDMEKLCLEKIKEFSRPKDSTADCPFHDIFSNTDSSSSEEEEFEDDDSSNGSEDDDYSVDSEDDDDLGNDDE